MTDSDDKYRRLQESLSNIQGQFHVLDTHVSVEKQMAYFRYSENLRKSSTQQPPIEETMLILNSPDASEEEKKYAMTVLAISGDVKAYRALEAYTQHPDENLKDWAGMSFIQAKMTLESELSEKKQIFISTGLGGKGDKFRFFTLFKSKNLVPFSPYQIRLIEKEIPFSINEAQGIVEELKVFDNYFTLIFLISIKANIKNIIEGALTECNQYGDFIDRSFIITNVKIFDEKDIQYELKRYLKKSGN
ncbi:MAG: hypothetical protein FWD60_09250 [Candidatus Azobacteroides sp.]|nr:hypothetical protein [Candidatus Azobacteroides sp.]